MKKLKQAAIAGLVGMAFIILTACGGTISSSNTASSTQDTTATQNQEASTVPAEKVYDTNIEISTTFFGADDTAWKQDDMYNFIAKKFNVNFKFTSIDWDTWDERDRVWINSGDMPDICFWDFNFKDYINYAKQGLIKVLPSDYETKYPDLAKTMETTGIVDYLKEKLDGKIYAVPKSSSVKGDIVPKELEAFYFVYRKDWATKLGINVGEVVTLEEFKNLAKEFVQKDPGGNGAGKTIGISGNMDGIIPPLMQAFNSYFYLFHKVDNAYIWGSSETSTFEGIKAIADMYKQGIIDKNFFSNKPEDTLNNFKAGKSGIAYSNFTSVNLNDLKTNFIAANPGIDVESAIGVFSIKGPDGNVHGAERVNYWAASIFNPKMDDDKFDRSLSIMNYLSTDEGGNLIHLGFEGKDYTKEGDKITITREQKNGSFVAVADIYKSNPIFNYLVGLPDGYSYEDPSIPEVTRNQAINLQNAKKKNGLSLAMTNLDILFFAGDNYTKFNVDVESAITEAVVSGGDIEKSWNKWLKSVKPKVDPVLDEINKALIK